MKKKTETFKTSAAAFKTNSDRKLEPSEASLNTDVKGKRVLNRKRFGQAAEPTRPIDSVPFLEFMESLDLHKLDVEREPDIGRDVQL